MALLTSASAQTSGDFFAGDIPEDGGVAMVTVAGGSIEDLRTAAEAMGFTTVFTTVDGAFVGFSLDVPDFVNDAFREAFPNGIPQGTAILVFVPGDGGMGGTGEAMTYSATLSPLNFSVQNVGSASGTATFTVDGDMLTVSVEATGLAPNMPHAQHIHAGDVCPGPDADANGDGFVDVIEGVPSYGEILVPLDDDLADTTSNDFPTADADGNLSYEATASIQAIEDALGEELAIDTRHVVQHGVGSNVTVPSTVQSLGDLPAAATLPVNCGQITSGAPDAPQSFSASIGALNDSGDEVDTASGTATFTVNGDMLTVTVEASGLEPGIAHAQHIHAGTSCPGPEADANSDGYVDVVEGVPTYGEILVPLDDDLADTASNTFPTADAEGNLAYTSSVSLTELEDALGMELNIGARHYVVHGVNADLSLPDTVQSLGDLPAVGTLPVGCGTITATMR
ncbi:MAG: CHRD domain-containing protein [Dehalococcoidia bacterium]